MRQADRGGSEPQVEVNVELMNALVAEMVRVHTAMVDRAAELRRIMDSAQLSQTHPPAVAKTAAWVNDRLPSLRRRAALAVKAAEVLPGGFRPGTPVPIYESQISTRTPAEARADADRAATRLLHDLDNHQLDSTTVAALKAGEDDPYFAAQLARRLSPAELSQLAWKLHGPLQNAQANVDNARPDARAGFEKAKAALATQQEALLATLGESLALASRQTGDLALPADYADQWMTQITNPTGVPAGRSASLSMLLHHGTWSTPLLTGMGKKIEDYEHSGDFTPGEWSEHSQHPSASGAPVLMTGPDGKPTPYDPLAGVLFAMGRNPDAAQSFLKDPVRLKNLLLTRKWADGNGNGDHGDGLGNALEAATTAYRGPDTQGKASALIASQMVNDIGSAGGHLGAGMRDSVGRILAGYIIDVDRVASGGGDYPVPGVWDLQNTDLPGTEPPGARFNKAELATVMKAAFTDVNAFRTVSAAALQEGRNRFDVAADQARTGTKDNPLYSASSNTSALLGYVANAGGIAQVDEAAKHDANRKAFIDLARGASALAPIPGGALVQFAVGQGKDALANHFQTHEASRATDQANVDADLLRPMMYDMATRSMADHGVLGTPTVGGQLTDPYHTVERGAPNDFTDGAGRIKPAKAMTQLQSDTYKQWLTSNQSPLTKLRASIDSGFVTGFDPFKKPR